MTNRPSPGAFARARSMAIQASKEDRWMTAIPEEYLDEGSVGHISQGHREGWEQTTHFDINYRMPLMDLAEIDSGCLFGDEPYSCEDYYESHYIPLLEAFWETWEEKVGFYEELNNAR